MLAARNLRPQQLSRRFAAPPNWGLESSEVSNSARRAIATSPQPAQEEKGRSTMIQEWWFLIPAGLFGSAAWNFFRARGKSPILVNRGWVPLSWGNKAAEVESNSSSSSPSSTQGREEPLSPSAPVQFVGVISKGERPNKLWRSNDPAKSEWFTVDVPSVARACGFPETTLHVVEIDSE